MNAAQVVTATCSSRSKTPRKHAVTSSANKVTSTSASTHARKGKDRATRKKSSGTVMERAFKKGKRYCTVTCRLKTVCPDPDLREQINSCVRWMKQVQLEAWHLVNLHTLRCLESNGTSPLPTYNASFFDRCCAGVAPTERSDSIVFRADPQLWHTIRDYRIRREATGLQEVADRTGLAHMKSELRRQMMSNAMVMLRENFRCRLRAYVMVVYPDSNTNDIVNGCYNTRPTILNEVRELRGLLTPHDVDWNANWIPWSTQITDQTKIHFYIRLLWKFQRVVEDHIDGNPGTSLKGVKAFSLFPVSKKYEAAHITINATTLAGLCSRITKVESLTGDRIPITRWWGVDYIRNTPRGFAADKWTVMRKAFAVNAFETMRGDANISKADFQQLAVSDKYAYASHLFANQVTTDGYSASILLYRQENDLDKELDHARGQQQGAKERRHEHPALAGYTPNVVIGIDPGMRSLCTAVREPYGHARAPVRRVRRRSVRKKRRSWIRRTKLPRRKNGRDIVEVHGGEYRHLAGFRKHRAWENGLRKTHLEYAAVIAGMPSFKTSRYVRYRERLTYFWRHARFMLDFCWDKPFRKWRFYRMRCARIAIDAIAARIVPVPSQLTCVAFGNWCLRNGIRGHAPVPVKGLRRALAKRAKLVIMDEFRTSKLCSSCHHELSRVAYDVDIGFPKRRKHKGKPLRRRRYIPLVTEQCHPVLRCQHRPCDANYWNRDVNAAINIVNLLKFELEHGVRMPAFTRGQ